LQEVVMAKGQQRSTKEKKKPKADKDKPKQLSAYKLAQTQGASARYARHFRACCRCERRGRQKILRFNVPTTGAISGAGITTAKRPVTHNTLSAEQRI